MLFWDFPFQTIQLLGVPTIYGPHHMLKPTLSDGYNRPQVLPIPRLARDGRSAQ